MKNILFALLLLSLLLTACGTDIPQIPPAEVITRAGDAMLQAPSFHFKIDISGKPVVLNQVTQLSLRSAEGDFARPDKMGVHLKVLLAVAAAELDMIALGNEQYLTNVLTKQWEVLPPEFGFNPAVMFDPQVGLEQLLKAGLDNAHWIGVETLDGKSIFHVQGSISGERAARHERRPDRQRSRRCRSVDRAGHLSAAQSRHRGQRQRSRKAHDVDDDVLVVWQRRQHHGTESAIVR